VTSSRERGVEEKINQKIDQITEENQHQGPYQSQARVELEQWRELGPLIFEGELGCTGPIAARLKVEELRANYERLHETVCAYLGESSEGQSVDELRALFRDLEREEESSVVHTEKEWGTLVRATGFLEYRDVDEVVTQVLGIRNERDGLFRLVQKMEALRADAEAADNDIPF